MYYKSSEIHSGTLKCVLFRDVFPNNVSLFSGVLGFDCILKECRE